MPESIKRALKYFSTHCWQKKQAASVTISLRRRRICEATLKSFSAFLTHSRVVGFIHHLALSHDFAHKKIALSQALGNFHRRAHQQIERKITRYGMPDSHRHSFAASAHTRHYHQQINIGVKVRPSVSMGAEQDNLAWAKL